MLCTASGAAGRAGAAARAAGVKGKEVRVEWLGAAQAARPDVQAQQWALPRVLKITGVDGNMLRCALQAARPDVQARLRALPGLRVRGIGLNDQVLRRRRGRTCRRGAVGAAGGLQSRGLGVDGHMLRCAPQAARPDPAGS